MIKKFENTDLCEVMKIWLDSNIEAHSFVPRSYWEDNFSAVEEALPRAEVYVYEDENCEIQGFIGLDESYIAGIFVRGQARSKGIGKSLLDRAKSEKDSLSLSVYAKNERAVRFYQRENFKISSESVDEETGEKEYLMVWERK